MYRLLGENIVEEIPLLLKMAFCRFKMNKNMLIQDLNGTLICQSIKKNQ